MCFPLFVGVLWLSLFCYALLCVHSSFEIILNRKRKLAVLLLVSYRCIVTISYLWLFLTVLWAYLQCAIVVFPDHTHFLQIYLYLYDKYLKQIRKGQGPILFEYFPFVILNGFYIGFMFML